MALTASAGPQVTYGITISSSGGVGEYNDSRGPTLNDLGSGLMDPRTQFGYGYNPGQAINDMTFGFWGQQAIGDFIPGTISSNNIALTSTGTGGGNPIVLTASGINTSVVSIIAPETGKLVTGLICIDQPCGGSTNATVAFGQSAAIGIWNPASVIGRCITIRATAAGDAGSWTIAGRDVYGFKVTESITAAATMVSAKAYKYISAINAPATLASTNIIVGTADTYGFPMLVQHPGYVQIWLGASSVAALVTASTGNHTFGSSLATATSAGGDVRGTYASSVASSTANGVRILMIVNPEVGTADAALSSYSGLNNISPTNFYNLFGATQFSSV